MGVLQVVIQWPQVTMQKLKGAIKTLPWPSRCSSGHPDSQNGYPEAPSDHPETPNGHPETPSCYQEATSGHPETAMQMPQNDYLDNPTNYTEAPMAF